MCTNISFSSAKEIRNRNVCSGQIAKLEGELCDSRSFAAKTYLPARRDATKQFISRFVLTQRVPGRESLSTDTKSLDVSGQSQTD